MSRRLTILSALQVLDLVTTFFVLRLGGVEMNPVGALILGLGGFAGLVVLKVVVTGNAIHATRRLIKRGRARLALGMVAGLNVVYFGVVGWNALALVRYAS